MCNPFVISVQFVIKKMVHNLSMAGEIVNLCIDVSFCAAFVHIFDRDLNDVGILKNVGQCQVVSIHKLAVKVREVGRYYSPCLSRQTKQSHMERRTGWCECLFLNSL